MQTVKALRGHCPCGTELYITMTSYGRPIGGTWNGSHLCDACRWPGPKISSLPFKESK
jgi:hypothetical protein